jgi:hypothetical protein
MRDHPGLPTGGAHAEIKQVFFVALVNAIDEVKEGTYLRSNILKPVDDLLRNVVD